MNKIHEYLRTNTEPFKNWPAECKAEAELIGKSNFQYKCNGWHNLVHDEAFIGNACYRLKPDYVPDALLTLKRALTPDQRVELMKNKSLFAKHLTPEMSPCSILYCLFVWDKSVQGLDYWFGVSKQLAKDWTDYLKTCDVIFEAMPVDAQEAARKIGKSNFQYYSDLYTKWIDPCADGSSFFHNTKYRLKDTLIGKKTLDSDGDYGVVSELLSNGCFKIKYDDPDTQSLYGDMMHSKLDVEKWIKTFESKFPVGCEVTVYDKYRYDRPIKGKIFKVLETGGYYVDFWNPSRLENDISLFHTEQCRISGRDILKHALTPEQFSELQKCDVRREVLESGIQDPVILLECLFSWRDSPQGYAYWNSVMESLKAYENMTKVKL